MSKIKVNKANLDDIRIKAMSRLSNASSFPQEDTKFAKIVMVVLDAFKEMNLKGPVWWVIVSNVSIIASMIKEIVKIVNE